MKKGNYLIIRGTRFCMVSINWVRRQPCVIERCGENVNNFGICALVDVIDCGRCMNGRRWYMFELNGETYVCVR